MTHEYKHPKYYAEMRAERRKLQATSCKRQAASDKLQAGRRPAPSGGGVIRALRQPQPPAKYIGFSRISQELFCRRTLESRIRSGARQSFKPQAASFKRQAASVKLESFSLRSRIWWPENNLKEPWLGSFASMKVFLGWLTWNEIWWGENRIRLPLVIFSSTVKKWELVL